jgi:hypothetical protein
VIYEMSQACLRKPLSFGIFFLYVWSRIHHLIYFRFYFKILFFIQTAENY